ncbi:hypothetical protein CKO44_22200 [Rubrivivax gelatinosus]|uniref:hypothetical protein n=1 Tax=Rubrivivax gelatinosus TaxID=28068 RepID=UPI0019058AF1|nr:hypothetical protein [Rubrivivax gelatinosus]MBK1616171.1 hypothetical protein [Rubrivivax gelatinosus]
MDEACEGAARAERSLAAVRAAWDAAPPRDRITLLSRLLQPLGPLARMAVASGAFAAYVGREHWAQVQVRLEDAMALQADQVLALAHFAFDVQPEVLSGMPSAPAAGLGLAALAATLTLALRRR